MASDDMNAAECALPDCGGSHYAKGLCQFHYDRKRRGRPLDAPRGMPLSIRGRTAFFDWAACGTPAQYQKHLRHHIEPCEPCRRAENRRTQDRRQLKAA